MADKKPKKPELKNKSHITIEPDPSAKSTTPYILDEGGVPRYQLPTEKTRYQAQHELKYADDYSDAPYSLAYAARNG